MPPPIAARMAMTIDSIAPGRFGLNIISGWQRAEYAQMGIWPGMSHYERRYQYCSEYVTILKELWATGHSDYKGRFLHRWRIAAAARCRRARYPDYLRRRRAMPARRYAAEFADYNFCNSFGVNKPTSITPSVARLVDATKAIRPEMRRADPGR